MLAQLEIWGGSFDQEKCTAGYETDKWMIGDWKTDDRPDRQVHRRMEQIGKEGVEREKEKKKWKKRREFVLWSKHTLFQGSFERQK